MVEVAVVFVVGWKVAVKNLVLAKFLLFVGWFEEEEDVVVVVVVVVVVRTNFQDLSRLLDIPPCTHPCFFFLGGFAEIPTYTFWMRRLVNASVKQAAIFESLATTKIPDVTRSNRCTPYNSVRDVV